MFIIIIIIFIMHITSFFSEQVKIIKNAGRLICYAFFPSFEHFWDHLNTSWSMLGDQLNQLNTS